jgi:hypothetical protein
MIRGFVEQVYPNVSPCKAINPSLNHAHENRHDHPASSYITIIAFRVLGDRNEPKRVLVVSVQDVKFLLYICTYVDIHLGSEIGAA